MTINIANNDPRINYTATAGQTVFTVPFEFFDNTDIKVYIEGTLKTITTHYTVSGGNGSTGTVTLGTGATLNDEVTLVRDVPMERTTDLTSSYNGSSIDAQLDRIVAQIADLDDKASRTIQINDYELASGLLLPALDNRKGKTIQFNTSTGALEVGPTGADLTAIGSVTSEIATLASISSDITTVAGANAAITAVGNSMTSVNAINAALSNVNSVAGGLTNINLVGGSIADVNDVADSLGEISAVQAKLTNIDTVAVASTNIGTVAGSITQVNNVASNISDVTGVNTNMSAITTANANSANINLVASSIDDVNDVGTVITKVTTVADNIANVNLVAPVAQYMSDVANNITAISAVAPLAGDLANVTSNLSAIQNSATNATNAANSATAAANSATSIGNAEVTTTANAVAAANSAAAAATALDNFDDKYLGVKSSDPTVDNDGDALVQGALYFSSSSSAMQVYDGANWIAASSSGVASLTLFEYTATAGQTAFSGNDDNGLSMSFIAANLLVTMNGVILDPSDYTTTSGLTVTLDVGAAVNDVVNIYAFKSFQVADTVPATTGGTFIGPVTFNSNVTVGGTVDGVDIAAFKTSFDNLSTDIVSDTTPQLGGDLASNGNDINFADNDKAKFGAGSDLNVWHNGSHSYVQDTGTGNLYLAGSNVIISNPTATETMAYFDDDGGASLWYDNSVKLATTSTGVDVTGTVTAESLGIGGTPSGYALDVTAPFGSAIGGAYIEAGEFNKSILTLNHTNSSVNVPLLSIQKSGSDVVTVDSSGNVGIGTSNPNANLHVNSSGQAIARVEGSNQYYSGMMIRNNYASQQSQWHVAASGGSSGWGTVNGNFVIRDDTTNSTGIEIERGAGGASGALYIDSSGNVGIGTSSPDTLLHVNGQAKFENNVYLNENTPALVIPNGDFRIFTGGAEKVRIDSSGNLLVGTTDTTPYNNSANSTADNGIALGSSGILSVAKNNDSPIIANRTGSDGGVIKLHKSGVDRGVIGLNNGDPYIARNLGSGMRWYNGAVVPTNDVGNDSNNTMDLGSNSVRFKHGYFSGNLYGDGSNLTGVGGSTTAGAVGTYALLRNVNTYEVAAFGDTKSGSNLQHSSSSSNGYANGSQYRVSGTWRNMGNQGYSYGSVPSAGTAGAATAVTVYVRIS